MMSSTKAGRRLTPTGWATMVTRGALNLAAAAPSAVSYGSPNTLDYAQA